MAAAACLIAAQGMLLGRTLLPTAPGAPLPGPALLPALAGAGRTLHGQEGPRPERTMVFLLNFTDFTCPPCFADFLALADSLRLGGALRDGREILGLMREGGAERLHPAERLRRWAQESGLGFPVSFLPDSLFDATGARKSLAAVLDRDERVLFRAEFPMGTLQRTRALDLFRR